MEMNMTTPELFHKIEKDVAGYDDYINADQQHYLETLADIDKLIIQIHREALFSQNEELKDV
jgi:hypothetical protein